MGFESYTLSNGFDRYFSREDYPSEKDFDGTWGIFDGPFMEYSIDQIDLIKKPFLVGIFTLSSHQPYSIPLTYKGKFPKGSLEIHESIGYTDFALKSFFEKARTREWFKDTIFIITADHTSKLESKKFNNMIGRYRVPLIVYPMLQGANESKISQHSDIPKTILHLLGINNDTLPLTGQSLLNRGEGLAVNFSDGRDYFLLTNRDSFLFNGVEQRRFTYDWDTGEILLGQASENLMLKAYLQYFLNGLITNNLSSYQ
jgi:phosphoglycerol transferase MdoB-like AlkP superfamily enzyme